VLAHPGFVGAACQPVRHHPDPAAPSFTSLLRQDGAEGLPPPLKSTAPHGALSGGWNLTPGGIDTGSFFTRRWHRTGRSVRTV